MREAHFVLAVRWAESHRLGVDWSQLNWCPGVCRTAVTNRLSITPGLFQQADNADVQLDPDDAHTHSLVNPVPVFSQLQTEGRVWQLGASCTSGGLLIRSLGELLSFQPSSNCLSFILEHVNQAGDGPERISGQGERQWEHPSCKGAVVFCENHPAGVGFPYAYFWYASREQKLKITVNPKTSFCRK